MNKQKAIKSLKFIIQLTNAFRTYPEELVNKEAKQALAALESEPENSNNSLKEVLRHLQSQAETIKKQTEEIEELIDEKERLEATIIES